jgi:hypothetical protein
MAAMVLVLAAALMPQTLRNTAATPGSVGDKTLEVANDSSPAGEVEAFKTAPATAGYVDHMSVYLTSDTTATSVLVGLYSDAGSKPGTLLASGKISTITKNAWNSLPISTVTLSATTYWIALSGQAGAVGYRDRCCGNGGTLPAQSAAGTYTSLPASWTTGSYTASGDAPLSAYAVGTATAPTPTPAPAPTPFAINNVACTVTISGTQQTGSCSGTFTPKSSATPTPTPATTATPTPAPTSTPAPTPTPTPASTPTPAPSGATLFVSATGSDSNACSSSAPCRSLDRAYAVARTSGDTVSIAAGSYGDQSLPGGTKTVTFRAVSGAKIRSLNNAASNVTFDGLDLDAGGAQQLTFDQSGDSVTFKNGRIGNVVDEKGAILSGTDVTVDNTLFHDVIVHTDGVHNECAYVIVAERIHIRNSTFTNCATMDIMLTYGSWWTPLPPDWGNGVIENNKFYHPRMMDGQQWHYYGLLWNGAMPSIHGWTVRNNWFETILPGQPGSNDISADKPYQGGVRCGNTQSTPGVLASVWTQPC